MGDDDHRPAFDHGGQRLLDGSLRRGVEARRRFVEDDHGGVGERDAGDADELALPRGEADAARLHVGLEPVRKRGEPLERADLLERVANLVVGRLRVRKPNVVGEGAAEEVPLLRQHHDPVPQRLERAVAQVDAAQPDRPVLRVVLACQQLREGRLARAGDADERHVLARLEAERDALHHGRAARVPKGHVVELEHAVRR